MLEKLVSRFRMPWEGRAEYLPCSVLGESFPTICGLGVFSSSLGCSPTEAALRPLDGSPAQLEAIEPGTLASLTSTQLGATEPGTPVSLIRAQLEVIEPGPRFPLPALHC